MYGIFTYIWVIYLPILDYIHISGKIITTSLFSRTLETWFILGKSSPNGRKIQVSEIW